MATYEAVLPRSTAAPRAYWLAWAATVTFFAGFYALLVPLPRYLAAAGLPDWQVGLVLGAFGIASLVGRPLAGVASDRYGARRVMLAGSASLLVGAGGVGLTTGLPLLFALRVFQAGGYVLFTTAGAALVVSLVPPEERGRRLAVFGAAANVAITLTPAAVAALLELVPLTAGLALSSALALVGGVLTIRIGAAADRSKDARPAVSWAIPRRLWLPMAASSLFGAGFAAFFQFAPILADRRPGVSVGLLYAVYGLGIIATRFTTGGLLDRVALGRVLAAAAAMMTVGLALLAASTDGVTPLGAALLVAAGGGLFHPALIAHHAALLPEAPGRATASFYLAFDLGIGAGSWLLGLALQLGGLGGLYWCACALVLATLPLIRAIAERSNRAGT